LLRAWTFPFPPALTQAVPDFQVCLHPAAHREEQALAVRLFLVPVSVVRRAE
jgi:hypothetical protein